MPWIRERVSTIPDGGSSRPGGSCRLEARWLARSLALACAALLGCSDSKEAPPPAAFSATAAPPDAGALEPEWAAEESETTTASPGRTVRVRVLDRNAQPVPGARVYATIAEETTLEAVVTGGGEHRLDGVDGDRVPIWVEVAGQRHGVEHPSARPRATVVLPVGGRLEVVWRVPSLARLPLGSLHLNVTARADPEVHFDREIPRQDELEGRLWIPYLAPGEYTAALELWRVPDDEDAEDTPAKVLPLTSPRALRIQEEQATRIVLGAPNVPSRVGKPPVGTDPGE